MMEYGMMQYGMMEYGMMGYEMMGYEMMEYGIHRTHLVNTRPHQLCWGERAMLSRTTKAVRHARMGA